MSYTFDPAIRVDAPKPDEMATQPDRSNGAPTKP
jgi:hypothetical protein